MHQNTIQLAAEHLLAPTGLIDTNIQQVFSKLMQPKVDYADLYFQSLTLESWYLDDGIVKEGSYDCDKGVGVRVNSGEKTGFAYSDEIILPALMEAGRAAASIIKQGQERSVKAWQHKQVPLLYPATNPIESMQSKDKVALLYLADKVAREADSRVKQVSANLVAVYETVLIFDHEGRQSADIRPLVRFNISVIVEDQHGRREKASEGGGSRGDLTYFVEQNLIEAYAKSAVKQAVLNLEAIEAPAGMMPVILGPGWPGVLLHEAIGHGMEGDFIRKKTSAFTDMLGKKVASSKCTIVDDGTLRNRRGSLSIDDEGEQSQCTTLIKNGILKGFMYDKLNARLMGVKPTGNGRRESYAHVPMPRMTNTYMLPGDDLPEDIIKSVDRGIYAVNFGGGQVDITSGKFVFSASEAYLIENGKITAPVKGATLIGSGPEVLKKVSMVGNDLALDSGVGVCGKDGQSVPVGVGQPTLKVDELVVGGTQHD